MLHVPIIFVHVHHLFEIELLYNYKYWYRIMSRGRLLKRGGLIPNPSAYFQTGRLLESEYQCFIRSIAVFCLENVPFSKIMTEIAPVLFFQELLFTF